MGKPELIVEHRMILTECRTQIEQLRRLHPGTDVIVIIDCVAYEGFAQALGLAIPHSTAPADTFVLAVGSVPLNRCREAFPSHSFPRIAQALKDGLTTPLAYRTIVVTDRGATTAQNIYVPAGATDA